jgi:hypothetical protein
MNFHKHLIKFLSEIEQFYGRGNYVTEIKLIPTLYDRVALDIMEERHEFCVNIPTSITANYYDFPIRITKDPEAAKEDIKDKAKSILRLIESNSLGSDFIEEVVTLLKEKRQ